jgi:hypothetical protein
MVVITPVRVKVVDVTFCHETTGYLQEGYKSKIRKYSPQLTTLAKQFNMEPGRVLPIVLGTSTLKSLRELHIKCIQLTDQQEYSRTELKSLHLAAKLLQNDNLHNSTEPSVESCNAVYTNRCP